MKGKLDILIICHSGYKAGNIEQSDITQFDKIINANLRSCLHLLSLSVPFLKLTKGNVVAISSIDADIPYKYSFLNGISKSMLNSLIKCAALELASYGIRVNAVCPGMTATDLRVGENFSKENNEELLYSYGMYFLLNRKVCN